MNLNTQAAVLDFIDNRTDGPITPYVLIARSHEAVAKGAKPGDASGALYIALLERGWICNGERK